MQRVKGHLSQCFMAGDATGNSLFAVACARAVFSVEVIAVISCDDVADKRMT